ncbi:D-alanyl-D-alanine carboxypeptidase [Rickettsiales endosymbiont of Peranema trichophorum]|uniref:D-alanyl-D-alanine carboxypeptidase family protein n=1 Tax=Rickettsiales endosymbiont of Peranema trichophorum TaxID=2486577 RepID=UPI001023C8FA|nr:D-alanyl-D-alanine carboxypeptidase family protein [Rickettsiales endosymbiont of Peranema trichophorum]RZI45992.1 D-alanyl-D-alanine carboxypeptidase [Rickettsiales endosymbiont of Peranema trichophorum]
MTDRKSTSNTFLLASFVALSFIMSTQLGYVAHAFEKLRTSEIEDAPLYASLVIDSQTGQILYAKNANETRFPASLTKMMTLLLTFEAIDKGKLRMNQMLKVPAVVAAQPPSKLGLKVGKLVSVKTLIEAAIVKSANDAVQLLGIAIGGSEASFRRIMNIKASQIGMKDTHFMNAHGLHHEKQVTTAIDMGKLALILMKKYPKYYHLFSKREFHYQGKRIKGHNYVLRKYNGAEGLKTGYTSASGFNLVTVAKKQHGRLIGIVLGANSQEIRDAHMIELLDHGFEKLKAIKTTKFSPKVVASPDKLRYNSIFNVLNNPRKKIS